MGSESYRQPVPNSFSHMILDVSDIDRSLEFYHGILELPIRRQDDWDGHRLAYLETGGTEILLVQQPLLDQDPLLERSRGLVINFRVANLVQVSKFLQSVKVPILRGLEMAVWGERTILVADPDGYAVLLSEPVGAAH
jgi:lactoylglutathione lyase